MSENEDVKTKNEEPSPRLTCESGTDDGLRIEELETEVADLRAALRDHEEMLRLADAERDKYGAALDEIRGAINRELAGGLMCDAIQEIAIELKKVGKPVER